MIRLFSMLIIGVAIFIAVKANPPAEKHILFIGNSYTFGGNVPEQVRLIAANSQPGINYGIEMHVRGGATLAQHISETGALDTIRSQQWDVVVLQDASVMSFESLWADQMRQAAITLAEAAKKQGAEVVYYAHWAPDYGAMPRRQAVENIAESYAALAKLTGGQVARVGQLWQQTSDAGVTGLYAEDQHHASVKGAYVAAVAITQALGDVDPATSDWHPEQVSLAERDTVAALIAQYPDGQGGSAKEP